MNIKQLTRDQFVHLHRAVRCSNKMRITTSDFVFSRIMKAAIECDKVLDVISPEIDLVRQETRNARNKAFKLTERQARIELLRKKFTGVVYYIQSGRDCDGVEYGSSHEFDNQYEAEVYINSSYEWADGPMNFSKCTKEEYDSFESWSRDTFAEAMNY